jgi:D-alanyl-D-alanine carboxypeptidase/D-alanyl-D-alanine-endopeptidase (penicillin-binding protein 4)
MRSVLAIALLFLAGAAPAADPYRGLIWHAELLGGKDISTNGADRRINPASLVKIATTQWALERLGPEFWFETRFVTGGRVDREAGVLHGDLVVIGSGDPDFQPENGFLAARKLNELGIRRVTGRILVNDRFWIGWEGGTGRIIEDPVKRARIMAARLRRAMDPHRWDRATQRSWRGFASRRGIPSRPLPRVAVAGSYGPVEGEVEGRTLFVHRSKPLVHVLRRFNAYSNNDIERLEVSLGTPEDLGRRLAQRWNLPETEVSLETLSGLGVNRMTPRQVVHLLKDLAVTCRGHGMEPKDVLPVAGCDPGTLRSFFPNLNGPDHAASVTGKTGTLIWTDGGVSTFAGIASTVRGDVVFCVAMPRGGRKRHWARMQQEKWILDLIASMGGPNPHACPPPLPMPDAGARILPGSGKQSDITIAPGH